jgi:hypothetical protein
LRFRLIVGSALLLAASGALLDSRAQTVLETLIATQTPCRALKMNLGVAELGLDRLKEVDLEAADIEVRGDAVVASLAGRLSREAPDQALVTGDASARVEARAEADLASCDVSLVEVALSEFGGSLDTTLEPIAPGIEASLVEIAKCEIVSACQEPRAGR